MFKTNRYGIAIALVLSASVSSALAHEPKKAGGHEKGEMNHMDGMSGMHGMRMTGDQDYDFAMMMRKHHKMAVRMAEKELKEGKDAGLRAMAQSMLDMQTREAAQLDTWLQAHKPAKTAKGGMSGMMSGGMSAGESFSDLDKNHDGVLTLKELPPGSMLYQHFAKADSNHDGKLSRQEVEKHTADMHAAMGHE